MKAPAAADSASAHIDEKIAQLNAANDWRGKTLAHMRKLIHAADPEIVEEWKWVKPTRHARLLARRHRLHRRNPQERSETNLCEGRLASGYCKAL
jgi:hypothetical protein